MTAAWVTIGVLTAVTVAIKAGPLIALGGRALSERASAVIALLAAALLSALVLTETFGGDDGELVIDARVAGLAAAAGAILLRRSLIVTVAVAAAVTALVRAVSG